MKILEVCINNKIKCLKCNDIIQSKFTHDYNTCRCKSVAVDGGMNYLKRCGSDWIDVSDKREATINEKIDFIINNIAEFLYIYKDINIDEAVSKILEFQEKNI